MAAHIPETMHCDVLVIGSGAAGLSAAITAAFHGLKVIVAEKANYFGGTSAWSGGWLWIPCNPLAVRAGIAEDIEAPRRYLRSELGNRAADPRLDVFLENGPEMVEFFERETAVEWIDGNKIPDFHETAGRALGGRSVSAKPYDGRALGDFIAKLRPPLDVISLAGMGISGGDDIAHFFNATRKPASALHVLRRLARHARDLALHGRSMQLVNGNALIARLLRSALDLGVDLLVRAPAETLTQELGRVSGAVLRIGGNQHRVIARRGVVLAAGGFPHDRIRIGEMFDHAVGGTGHYSAAPEENSGDGIRLGQSVGARFETELAAPAAWAPVSLVPDGQGGVKRFPHLVERAKPGFIAVDRNGQRFVNEADSYHDFMQALFDRTPKGETPHAWLICDHRAQRRYGLGWSKPFPFPLTPYFRNGYLRRGRTLADLAEACGLPTGALERTLRDFNRHAKFGVDPEFERGASAYNRFQGAAWHTPNASLSPLETAPFYAVRIVPGSLGTFAGLNTTPAGQVVDNTQAPIEGLYAIGNDMTSVMGGHYPSGGITLGPGMTFGFVVGRILAGQEVSGISRTNNSIGQTAEQQEE
ncbi:FAD-dependent oxidoreductase [Roseibium aggregatum]|uniref:FAD-dependent oxidoreductase n=1 Tax=Roseibium aggregatum TaxID=187304 RepID=A0A926P3A3_9HYPH|nr:FAD-dependent oxidoreductase [Roseibium aggregatum]MBD1549406.1 FAD-dependent oxidoreductase [Roseibium aggregatum]